MTGFHEAFEIRRLSLAVSNDFLKYPNSCEWDLFERKQEFLSQYRVCSYSALRWPGRMHRQSIKYHSIGIVRWKETLLFPSCSFLMIVGADDFVYILIFTKEVEGCNKNYISYPILCCLYDSIACRILIWINDEMSTYLFSLSHWGRVTHICVSRLDRCWSR